MGEQNNQPTFSIEKLFVKDLSLEVPNAPRIYLEREAPQVEVAMNNAAKPVDEGFYEVVLTVTVTAKIKDKTVFLVEVSYGGVFQIRNVPEDVHRTLRVRAAEAGMSLSEYLLDRISRDARRPTVAQVLEQAAEVDARSPSAVAKAKVRDDDVVVVPVGGGGLISGVAIVMRELRPDVRVIGVEPDYFASMKAALLAGEVVDVPTQPTIADGLAVKRAGKRTLEIVRRYVDEVVTVSEGEIASAILKLLEIEKTVVEGGGAAALAAVLFKKITGIEGKNVAIVVSGGNIDQNLLSKIIARGLAKDGRMVRIRAVMRDRPGELARICHHVAEVGANILDVMHNRAFSNLEVGGVEIDMTLETRGHDHVKQLLRVLSDDRIEARKLD